MIGMNWIENYLKAGNPATSQKQLAVLARSDHHKIRLRVAENSNTPVEVLELLSKDKEADVRLAVAMNRATPSEIVNKLAYDEDPTVRHGLAEDPDTPIEILKMLSCDNNPYVSCRAEKTLVALGMNETSVKDFPKLTWAGQLQQRLV